MSLVLRNPPANSRNETFFTFTDSINKSEKQNDGLLHFKAAASQRFPAFVPLVTNRIFDHVCGTSAVEQKPGGVS